jgi:hypothetical protein
LCHHIAGEHLEQLKIEIREHYNYPEVSEGVGDEFEESPSINSIPFIVLGNSYHSLFKYTNSEARSALFFNMRVEFVKDILAKYVYASYSDVKNNLDFVRKLK